MLQMQRRRCVAVIASLGLATGTGVVWANDADQARGIVEKARLSFDDVIKTKEYDALRAGLKSAKGVLIFPAILKGGVIVGGSGGTGVLLARDDSGKWAGPAFYTLGSVSVGLQVGGQAAEVVILVNSQKGVDRLLTSSLKLGGDASVAAGPVGLGQAANLTADFVAYAKSKGAYVGMSVEGSVLDVRDTLNHAYYGKSVSPLEILVKRQATSEHANALRSAVTAASRQ